MTSTTPVYTTYDSPLGTLLLTGDGSGSLASVTVPGQPGAPAPGPGLTRDDSPFEEVRAQLDAYFAGELKEFRLPVTHATLTAGSTDFRRRVWEALGTIPYGATTTYGELAARIGAPRAAVRAVGGAVGANPLLIVRPCHRVIGADGTLTGYAGGLDRKRQLLTLEGAL
jgi:methylated-DNA-[protein]-cysteine S-methyltransferase